MNLKDLYRIVTQHCWTIGFMEYDDCLFRNNESTTLNIKWVNFTLNSGWLADPFILSVDEENIVLLAEEFVYKKRKGRISKVVINRNTLQLVAIKPIIETNTHLSFPAYFRYHDKVMIYPENTKTGKLVLYEYDEITDKTKPFKDLLHLPIADATIFEFSNYTYLSGTIYPNDNKKDLKLYSFNKDMLCVDFEEPIQVIQFKDNYARNAGMPFETNGKWYRPAQNCTVRYGGGVIIYEIKRKSDGILENVYVTEFNSPHKKYNLGFHTFNVYNKKLVVVDAQGYRYGYIARFLVFIVNLFKKLL